MIHKLFTAVFSLTTISPVAQKQKAFGSDRMVDGYGMERFTGACHDASFQGRPPDADDVQSPSVSQLLCLPLAHVGTFCRSVKAKTWQSSGMRPPSNGWQQEQLTKRGKPGTAAPLVTLP